jgi:transposase
VLAQTHRDWAVGYADETWWSRVAQPALHAWSEDVPRLEQVSAPRDDPDPKALACYGVLVRPGNGAPEAVWLRFVDDRPVSPLTTAFLEWCCARLAAIGMTTLVLIWDNAGWHISRAVRAWLRTHNHRTHHEGGVRLIPCLLPTKSPWLNPIEPQWVHGKRRVVEPARGLTAAELEHRVCAAFACSVEAHLIPHEVA